MRYVTFYYDLIRHIVLGLKVHEDKEKALKCFNSEFHKWFAINTKFKADDIPVAYGYPTRKYYGVSARTFKKMFDISVVESYGDNTDKKMFDISVDESYGDNTE